MRTRTHTHTHRYTHAPVPTHRVSRQFTSQRTLRRRSDGEGSLGSFGVADLRDTGLPVRPEGWLPACKDVCILCSSVVALYDA